MSEKKETAPGGQGRERETVKRLARSINENFGDTNICVKVKYQVNLNEEDHPD